MRHLNAIRPGKPCRFGRRIVVSFSRTQRLVIGELSERRSVTWGVQTAKHLNNTYTFT